MKILSQKFVTNGETSWYMISEISVDEEIEEYFFHIKYQYRKIRIQNKATTESYT